MKKRVLNADEIRVELHKRFLLMPSFTDDRLGSCVPVPRLHPLDAQLRNWDMDKIEANRYQRQVIEEARKEFFFSGAAEADERIGDAFPQC